MQSEFSSEAALRSFGEKIGRILSAGEFIELVGDVGAGKTTLVKGLVRGLGSDETVQSPTFTISRVYQLKDNRRFAHYDFYRLTDAGIMKAELAEAAADKDTIVAVEWADVVDDVLPQDRLTIEITPSGELARRLAISAGGTISSKVLEQLR